MSILDIVQKIKAEKSKADKDSDCIVAYIYAVGRADAVEIETIINDFGWIVGSIKIDSKRDKDSREKWLSNIALEKDKDIDNGSCDIIFTKGKTFDSDCGIPVVDVTKITEIDKQKLAFQEYGTFLRRIK